MQERLAYMQSQRGVQKFNKTIASALLPHGSIIYTDNASAENIRRYADSIGDFNPRFRDSDYAKVTKYGRLVAQPTFPTIVAFPFHGHEELIAGPKGYHSLGARSFNSGNEWEYFRPILEDDKLDFNGVGMVDAKLVKSRFSGEMIVTTSLMQYRNQRAEIVALNKSFVHHSSSDPSTLNKGKYDAFIQPYKYTDEEMRGSWPRYWEDVNEGDSLGYIVVGPWTIMSFFSMAGSHGAVRGLGTGAVNQGIRFPLPKGDGIYDPRINAWTTLNPHCDYDLGRAVGVQGNYDLGVERECLMSILFTNWMGDDGFLWKYSIQFRAFVVHGDTCWYRGKIVKKYIDDGKYCVDIEHWGENQRGERVTVGKATIILPSKVHGEVKYPTPRSVEDVLQETSHK
jgi:acyl dehydratase